MTSGLSDLFLHTDFVCYKYLHIFHSIIINSAVSKKLFDEIYVCAEQ